MTVIIKKCLDNDFITTKYELIRPPRSTQIAYDTRLVRAGSRSRQGWIHLSDVAYKTILFLLIHFYTSNTKTTIKIVRKISQYEETIYLLCVNATCEEKALVYLKKKLVVAAWARHSYMVELCLRSLLKKTRHDRSCLNLWI